MTGLLKGETAVVTGGASGIGRAIAMVFAEHGADVVVADVRERPRLDGRPTHDVIEADTDSQVRFVSCDVTNERELEAAVAAADEFGGVDVMVNNAGVEVFYDFLDSGNEEYDDVMATNAKSAYLGTRIAARAMLDDGGGSVLNVASIRSDVGRGNYVSYCASKGAVEVMTFALADALSPDVRVNAIKPGTIDTAMVRIDGAMDDDDASQRATQIPLERLGRPRDVANVAVFLSSDLAGYVSGESILVDGGLVNTSSM